MDIGFLILHSQSLPSSAGDLEPEARLCVLVTPEKTGDNDCAACRAHLIATRLNLGHNPCAPLPSIEDEYPDWYDDAEHEDEIDQEERRPPKLTEKVPEKPTYNQLPN